MFETVVTREAFVKSFLATTSTIFLLLAVQETAATAPAKGKAPANSPVKKVLPKTAAADPVDAYIKLVSPKIQQAWKAPDKTTAEKVVVSLTISADGKVGSVTIKEPSGDQAFDDATVESMKGIGQLPPMPIQAKDGMTLNYTFHAGNRNQARKADDEGYINAFSRKVNSSWRNPKVDKNYQVTVTITVDKSGRLMKAEITKPSGNKVVDAAGLTAAKLAEPYPPIPETLSDKMTVSYTFRAGPDKDVINKMQFNGVPLPQGDYQISSGGAQLKPLDVDTAINRKLQEREAQAQDRMLTLKSKLAQDESKYGAKSIQAAKAQHAVANCAVELHDYKEAQAAFSSALPVVESDPTQAAELHSLLADFASMYAATARLKEADPLLNRACELGKTADSIDPAKRRKVMEDYARLLYKLNRTKEADELYKQLKAKP